MRPYFFNHLIFFLFDEFDFFLNIQNLFLDYLKKNFHYRVFKEQNLSYLNISRSLKTK